MTIYFAGDIEKMQPKIDNFEKASVGSAVKDAVLDVLKYLNILHSKKFSTEVKNE